MTTIKIDPSRPGTDAIDNAVKVLNAGGIVAFPTDTVYGIAAMPLNKKAVSKLYMLKGRSNKKPIAILISSKAQARKFAASIPAKAAQLMKKHWPGPLTLIFEKRSSVPDLLTSGLKTIGIRMPKNNIALKLIKKSGGALAVTSANRSGNEPAARAGQIKGLKGIDLILDGGECEIGVPSSIISFIDGKTEILRKGSCKIPANF